MRPFALSAVSALLFAASFPSGPWSAVVFVALVPLLRALDACSAPGRRFAAGAVFGFIAAAGLAWWVAIAAHGHFHLSAAASALFVLAAAALPMALLYGLFAIAHGYLKSEKAAYSMLVFPSLWVLAEYCREALPLFLPWGLAGYALTWCTPLVQFADIAGVYGVSFLVAFVNAQAHRICDGACLERARMTSGAGILKLASERIRERRAHALALCLSLALVLAYGAFSLWRWDALVRVELSRGRGVPARIVQPAFSAHERWERANVALALEMCIKLSGESGGETRLVIWPETTLNVPASVRREVFARVAAYAGPSGTVIFGGTGGGRGEGARNSAYAVSGGGELSWYDKVILLPFAETSPFGLAIAHRYYQAPAAFEPGVRSSLLATVAGRAGVSICFERMFPSFIRDSVRRGAGLLVNLSNDAWFGRSTMPYAHRDIAVMRAVENRRFMLVASNTGVSAVIAPTGRIAAASPIFTRSAIDATVCPLSGLSPYTRGGDAILVLALAVVAAAAMRRIYRREGD